MAEKIDPKLCNVSENLGVLLDKALCEEDFRWKLVTEPDKILAQYEITDDSDLEVVYGMIEQLKIFVTNRAKALTGGNFTENFKKANPNLTYSDAMNYKKAHNQ